MDIQITTKGVELPESTRQHALDMANKMTRYYDRISEIAIVASRPDAHEVEMEMVVHVDRHPPFVATSRCPEPGRCVNELHDKMERQLSDHKERHRNRKHPV